MVEEEEVVEEVVEETVEATPKVDPSDEMELILGRKKGSMRYVSVQLDGDVRARIDDANLAVIQARQYDRKNNVQVKTETKAQAALDEILAAAKETEVEFSFKSLGRVKFQKLVRDHPPDEDQKKQGSDVNMDKFAPLLISMCSVKPKISLAQANEMWDSDEWNSAEMDRIYLAARDVNTEVPDIPLSNSGIDQILSSLLK